MYKGITKEDKRYDYYNHFTKTALIRYIFSSIETNRRNNKVFDEIHINYLKKFYTLQNEIDELKEFIELQKEEINELNKEKIVVKRLITEKKTYIIKDLNTGLYKIGCSNEPLKREKTLQSEKPNIKIIKIFDNYIEKELHKKYEKQRIRGEWFNLNEIQIKYICTHY
jgi:hypothetical protein